jgi:hypothetical protein
MREFSFRTGQAIAFWKVLTTVQVIDEEESVPMNPEVMAVLEAHFGAGEIPLHSHMISSIHNNTNPYAEHRLEAAAFFEGMAKALREPC